MEKAYLDSKRGTHGLPGRASFDKLLPVSLFVFGALLITIGLDDLLGYTSTFVLIGCGSGPITACIRGYLFDNLAIALGLASLLTAFALLFQRFRKSK